MRRSLVLVVLLFLLWAPGAYAWTWPVQGPVLLGFVFDPSHPYAGGQHRGIDIGAAAGTPVAAPASGAVTFAGTVPTSGKSVTIATADGYSVTLTHLGSIGVAKGASVDEGSAVGTVGPERNAGARRSLPVHGRARHRERAGLSRSALVPPGAASAGCAYACLFTRTAAASAGRGHTAGPDDDGARPCRGGATAAPGRARDDDGHSGRGRDGAGRCPAARRDACRSDDDDEQRHVRVRRCDEHADERRGRRLRAGRRSSTARREQRRAAARRCDERADERRGRHLHRTRHEHRRARAALHRGRGRKRPGAGVRAPGFDADSGAAAARAAACVAATAAAGARDRRQPGSWPRPDCAARRAVDACGGADRRRAGARRRPAPDRRAGPGRRPAGGRHGPRRRRVPAACVASASHRDCPRRAAAASGARARRSACCSSARCLGSTGARPATHSTCAGHRAGVSPPPGRPALLSDEADRRAHTTASRAVAALSPARVRVRGGRRGRSYDL